MNYQCTFAKGSWRPDDWLHVKRPDRDHVGAWAQREGCIENAPPPGATAEERASKFAGGDVHTSMVLREPVPGNAKVAASLRFAAGAGPSIVLALKLGEDPDGNAVYAEHYEATLFKGGVNLWHMDARGGKVVWRLLAFHRFVPPTGEKVALEIVAKAWEREGESFGKMLTVSTDGRNVFGCLAERMTGPFWAGVTACEGPSAAYGFSVAPE